jgi:hypothetical protein
MLWELLDGEQARPDALGVRRQARVHRGRRRSLRHDVPPLLILGRTKLAMLGAQFFRLRA